MKKLNTLSLIATVILVIACSKVEFSSNPSQPGSPGSPPPNNQPPPPSTQSFCNANNTATLNNGSSAAISLYNTGNGHYYGDISIGGRLYSAPSGNNPTINSLYDNGVLTTQYNYWTNSQAFSGFFQDAYGAIVLSVSSVDSNGCASGTIYRKDFFYTGAIQSPFRKCWFIYNGPFDCRADAIMNKSSLVPGNGYSVMATFTALPVSKAFN